MLLHTQLVSFFLSFYFFFNWNHSIDSTSRSIFHHSQRLQTQFIYFLSPVRFHFLFFFLCYCPYYISEKNCMESHCSNIKWNKQKKNKNSKTTMDWSICYYCHWLRSNLPLSFLPFLFSFFFSCLFLSIARHIPHKNGCWCRFLFSGSRRPFLWYCIDENKFLERIKRMNFIGDNFMELQHCWACIFHRIILFVYRIVVCT